jgi:hypothetical protein
MKKAIALALTALVGAALFVPATASAKKAKGPVVLGTDPAGDWGAATDPQIGPIGDALGQDLVEAAIEAKDKTTLNFIIKVNSLPPVGGTPEVTRYSWDFNVDGEGVELDGKFTNYSRGVCDPTAGSCPPPRDPGMQPFFVRGNCGVVEGTNVTTCQELGVVQAAFDAGAGTITIPVPLELIGAKKGSKITPGVGIFGGTIEASPAAFLTSGNFPFDGLTILKTYTVPKK